MKSLDKNTLELLRCPVTGSRLAIAKNEIVDWINQQIRRGELTDRSETLIASPVDGALVNDGNSLAMPIRAGVISLAPNRAISIEPLKNHHE